MDDSLNAFVRMFILIISFFRSFSRENLLVDFNGTTTSSETSSVNEGVEGDVSPANCASPTFGSLFYSTPPSVF